MENEKKYKVGIAGFGIVGRKRDSFIQKHEFLETVAVCDQRFKEESFRPPEGVKSYICFNEMIKEEDLDILFVCLPNDLAPKATIVGLENGLHVFCEKPPGRSVQDILDVREVESRYPNLKLKYGFNHRYHDSVLQSIEIINSGELGRLVNMRGVYGKAYISPWNQPAKDIWRTQREAAGGGILLDQGIHMVDLMRLYGGNFSEIKSFVSNSFWNFEVEDNAYALMKSDSGVCAMLHSTATQWRHRFMLELTYENAQVILSGILSGTKSYGAEKLTIVRRNPKDGGNTQEQTMTFIEDQSWWKEICEFANAIKNNTSIEVGTSEDALKTMEHVFGIYYADEDWRNRFNIKI